MAPIGLRAFGREDLPLLAAWLAHEHVARWWPMRETTVAALDAYYGPAIDGTDPTVLYLALADEVPVGFVETYRHADHPDWDRAVGIPGVAGIDYLIGEAERCGRGLGTAVIGALCTRVFELFPDVSGIVSAPQAANRASCRVLEKNGFRLVAVRELDSDDPGDAGPSAVYLRERRSR
ncbi:acetyltransferase [Actinospica durhamensis]|uniref:Lysine N-acyltransferase MbtK n=1 Tax=Actinospica durhamensis TaxID=1508375 RepID=A0A941IV71_9ACTN|nr:GNAT family N-acetyltransferase [Actinospica durhamensis]MBR7836561.1 acetyltransferase [Actinospica durhamensis]